MPALFPVSDRWNSMQAPGDHQWPKPLHGLRARLISRFQSSPNSAPYLSADGAAPEDPVDGAAEEPLEEAVPEEPVDGPEPEEPEPVDGPVPEDPVDFSKPSFAPSLFAGSLSFLALSL